MGVFSRFLGIRNWGFEAAATEGNDEIIDGRLGPKAVGDEPRKTKERNEEEDLFYHPPSLRVSKVGECMLDITSDGVRNWSSGLDDPELERGKREKETRG